MRNDGRTDASTIAAQAPKILRLQAAVIDVAAGPDSPRTLRIDRPSFVVGSGAGADLQLTDPKISREHLRLTLTPTGVQLRDEASKNGTWIGGLRLTEAVLTATTTLEIGDTKLVLRLEPDAVELPLSDRTSFGSAIGVSPAMRYLFGLLERAASSDLPILLEGESGVGKEILSRAVHAHSPRQRGPFVAVNCGAIAAGLIEGELFGYERGAFTGAVAAHRGVFEQASGGTLLLDEVGELALGLQPKLLRVLEEGEIRPLGSSSVRRIDVRVIAATNRRLSEAVRREEFRSDLFYRLAVARVTIPPLRERREDILPIARHMLRELLGNPASELPSELSQLLSTYSWPGNVRELRNVIQRFALLNMREPRELLDGASLAGVVLQDDDSHLPYQAARQRALDRFERAYLPRVLERAGGSVPRAAELAEVGRSSFYRMLERLRDPQSSPNDDGADPADR